MYNTEQRDYLLPKAYNAALRAGAAILDVYRDGGREMEVTVKEDYTPLTEADRRSHDTIKEYLATTHVPLLSEEGREMLYEERKGWDLFWMVDPLDGTKEFIKGNGEFTVNIALMSDNRPVLSVVCVPYIGKVYVGDILSGAFCRDNVRPDAQASFTIGEILSDGTPLPLAREERPLKIAVSRSHNTDETFRQIERLREEYPDLKIVEQGSSYKFCLIAEGSVDYYVRTTPTYEWDTAAGELILSLAGGQTSTFPDEKPFQYNKPTLHNPHFHCRSKYCPEVFLINW